MAATRRRLPRVLLVNSYDGRAMYAEYLRHRGFVVRPCRRPEQALRVLDAHTVDAIVTDLVFVHSAWSGDAFIREVRQRPASATIPIVVLSGLVREEDRKAAREAGADLYLMKPVYPEDLLIAITRALHAHARGETIRWNWPDMAPGSSDRASRTDRRRPGVVPPKQPGDG